MLANDYAIELHRLEQIGPVDIPHIKGVKTIIKDRLDAHTYDPEVMKHMANKPLNQPLSRNLTELRQGGAPEIIPKANYDGVVVDSLMSYEMGREVPYLKISNHRLPRENKALIYVHGGAYFGGAVSDTLIPLKYLATMYAGTIYSIDYGLAPEHPYPSAIFDCLSVVSLIAKDHSEVQISGDSAGASIALGVSQLANQLGICQIDDHVLFYPTIIHGSNHNGPLWDDKKISIAPNERKYLHSNYRTFKQLDRLMTQFYTDGKSFDLTSPIISPLHADPTNFKNLTVIVGEFDPFRLQDEALAEQVGTAGGDVTFIRYGGMGHAFFNYIGKCAVAEDSIIEANKRL
ncbi:alpha/beta hydrolase fold domain-containing protein [Companilactobacillus sp.]|jgi:acetyl esterase/lipase|uniref:alpha/beta hydrolase fold domain-containing protein n=2 Tax=Companilactobacillus sp. TaxID=2767905 RepID=UPI0025BD89D3|nr:alpha/beta hydrolase fold domain-containing protein [Companilactobacillus sp.]MCH4008598.1 alpha/beta hydrolase [Companilactobacillus sp.]MCH4051223.1 alpha/beta hydrolase [Companilactobacillus sp.]MCH4076541.1 alpha/beta hydrolase [Companilactobacillus sp.]MCH4125116.1 alpha/beta hydrolase [Companilactobacillus sp.]MCH4131656.1 alpha/beta hydrolase [Companilactobacillus sp.]